MTTATRLTGPWEGLRAYPRGFRTPDSRQRMEAALERLQHHRERFDRHINRAQSAIARIDALCDDAIARLDASDPDADFEDDREGDLCDRGEPSLCGVTCNPNYVGTGDCEAEHDGREPDGDNEASLSGTLGTDEHAVGAGVAGIGPFGEIAFDLEGDHDGREPEEDLDKSDYEPDEDASCAWADEGDQTTLTIRPVYVAPPRVERTGRLTGDCALNPAPVQRAPATLPPGWVRISSAALPTFSDGRWKL